jgi:hypothetical protein
VNDPFAVCDVDGTGEGLEERGGLSRTPGLAVQSVRQAAALDPFHGQEGVALVAADLVDLDDIRVLHPRRQLRLQPEPPLLGGRGELAGQDHLQGCQPVEAQVPRLVHDPHASPTDLAQDLVVPDPTGGRDLCETDLSSRLNTRVRTARESHPTQRANRRAALGRRDEWFFPARGALLELRQQGVRGGQLIDEAATFGTFAEVRRDAGQIGLAELAQGQRTQLVVGRVVGRGLVHGKSTRIGRMATKRRVVPGKRNAVVRRTLHQPDGRYPGGSPGHPVQSMRPPTFWRMRCRTRDFAT